MIRGRIASIVVAAGYSSRMHSFKPFLRFGEYTAVEMVVHTLKRSGIDDIIVVTGHRSCEVMEKLKGSGVRCVMNENYSQGMYSSVLKGLEALDEEYAAFFMQPVDVPLIKKHTLELLKSKYQESGKGVLYPVFCGKRGHPPLIDTKYKQAIIESDGEGGLKRILENFSEDSIDVPVLDEAVLMDMDTKEDYERLLKYFYFGAPNRNECDTILNAYHVPEHIVKHCAEVARVSGVLLGCLRISGYELDGAALEAAARLHDIARKEKRHELVGGRILAEMGYEHVGHIISTHTDIEVNEDKKVTENEILYLADKLVKEDKMMPLGQRLRQCLEAYGDDSEAAEKIESRFEAAGKIIKKLEKILGIGFIDGCKDLFGEAR